MKSFFRVALLASAIAGGSLVVPTAASARDSFSIYAHSGDVAFAYSDGWWDNDHHFHHWRNHSEARWYQRRHRDDYNDWRHDRDRDHGWHDRGDHHDDRHD